MYSQSFVPLQILFMISSSQSGKKFCSIPSSGRFFPKKKSLALSNKINTFLSKYYCKVIWKYYRVIKNKMFRLAVKLEIALALSIIKLNEISRYQIASKEFFFNRQQEGFSMVVIEYHLEILRKRTKNLNFYFQK